MKRMIGLTLACTMLCSLAMPVSAEEFLFNVECTGYDEANSDSEVWASLDTDGLMTISGTGAMDFCGRWFLESDDREFNPPWLKNPEYRPLIEKLVVEEGVTNICDIANFSNLKSVYLPNSLEELGTFEFFLCTSLENVFIAPGAKGIETGVFMYTADNFTIYGYKGTFAEEYAGTYEYNFRAMGDTDADNTIDLSDASDILSLYADIAAGNTAASDGGSPDAADVDQDGVIGLSDASCVISYYAQNAAGLAADWNELMGW